MTQTQRRRSASRGFTLLEALIALLVLSFGMLAIAGFQTTLLRSSDLAKQRAEALRLAQQKMETLRAFGQVATDPTLGLNHKFNYTDNVVSSTVVTPERPIDGPDIIISNATFSRTWTVAANAADTEKWINIVVGWDDRAARAPVTGVALSRTANTVTATATAHGLVVGDWVRISGASVTVLDGTFSVLSTPSVNSFTYWMASPPAATTASGRTAQKVNAVQLVSSISKFDPQSVGTLATGPGGTNVRRPKNRNLNIPYPAIGLSGGTQSAFSPPPGGVTYIFNNDTGNIVQSCTGLAATPAVSIGAVTRIGTAVTVIATGHTFQVGNRVTIAGVVDTGFNGTFIVVTTAANSFTYTLASPPLALVSSSGTATLVVTQLTEGFDLAAAIAAANGVVCTTTPLDAYLLSGYVRFDSASNPSAEEPNTVGNNNATLALSAAAPLLLDTSNQPTPANSVLPSMVCYAERQKVVSIANPSAINITSLSQSGGTVSVAAPSHGFSVGQSVAVNGTSSVAFIGAFVVATVPTVNTFTYTLPPSVTAPASATGGTVQLLQRLTIAESASATGYSNVNARFVSYACVVTPVDHDVSNATPKRWWGRVTLNPAGWTIGSSNYKVCRYSADYNGNGAIANAEHPQWYRGVTGALDSQNYLVITGNNNCPTEKAANPFSNQKADYSDDTTALQQPYSSTGVFSFQCPVGGCGTPNTLEPTTTATDLLMD